MHIYTESRVITLPHSIEYDDINKICKELNLPETVGNVIDLPLNNTWLSIMNRDSAYNTVENVTFHNLRRIIFYVPHDNINKITKFSTDYTVNNKSVLTHEDVTNIFI